MTDADAARSLILTRLVIEREALGGALFIALGALAIAAAAVTLAFSAAPSLPTLLVAGIGAVLLVHGVRRRASAARAAAALDEGR
ncbi:hypothetical protein [Microbacterium oleivorans]|uniref:Uncharacterized protein n=1 Tax=Microbacterium oleivorans TaxID=273677 RepID=A0A7D5ISP4_9MICO|nr:hypothetical protein [Microbacterium oleivorans]QLD11494.1 hypothetical protein HW566_06740 [Microbacterium oleivorans]